MSTLDIRQILDASPARRVPADGHLWFLDTSPWWRLFQDLRGLEQTKLAILDAAWQLPMPLFFLPEPPLASELSPYLEEAGNTWRINRSRPASQFYGTQAASGVGNWRLYAAERPITADPPDAFRSTSQQLLTYLKDQGVVLWIDCFHDDTDWCVALRDPVPSIK